MVLPESVWNSARVLSCVAGLNLGLRVSQAPTAPERKLVFKSVPAQIPAGLGVPGSAQGSWPLGLRSKPSSTEEKPEAQGKQCSDLVNSHTGPSSGFYASRLSEVCPPTPPI